MTIATSLISNSAIIGIDKLKRENASLSDLLKNLNDFGDLILVGGAARDFTYQKSPRDFDIIIDTEKSNFDEALTGYFYRSNRFGGYKVTVKDIELDIWSIQENWAFKEKIFDTDVKNIERGTFYNFDAISINLNTSNTYADFFLKSIKDKMLDITLDDEFIPLNPAPEMNVMRAFVIKKYWGLSFSDKVNQYITDWIKNIDCPYELLAATEIRHYGCRKLNIEDYHY